MILTFAEDFSVDFELDSQLLDTPDSGLYWNRGVHPILTLGNLLDTLPLIDITPSDWLIGTTYNKFETSRKRSDLVTYDGSIYQSLTDSNIGNQPDISSSNWLETNIESLRIKSFIWTVEDNFISALTLNRRLLENQYIYNVGKESITLGGDYNGWAFEPKGSDYVRIRINQMAIQANTTGSIDIYVINQGQLITTLALTANNGRLVFEDEEYDIYGKGRFIFAFDSQEVLSENAYNDALRYDSFVAYPVIGTGAMPQAAEYKESNTGNGLNFNVSTYLDSSQYITNNKIDYAKFLQTQFEYDFLRMILHNTNNRSNINQKIQESGINKQILATETLNIDMGTVARKYEYQKKMAIDSLNKTFDKFMHKNKGLRVKRTVL